MRPDMGKCVIERERSGSSNPSAKARWYGKITDGEEGPDYDGMTRLPSSRKQEGYHKKIGDKNFTDVLGPIEGYLQSKVGQYWPKIYSELIANLGHGPWAIRHILHAHINVAVKTYRDVSGRIWSLDRHGPTVVDGGYRTEYYVEPKTQILRRHPDAEKKAQWKRFRNPKPDRRDLDYVKIDERLCYLRIEGVWFRGQHTARAATFKELNGPYRWGRVYEVPQWPDIQGRTQAEILVFQKLKSCSKKEIRELLQIRNQRLKEKFPTTYKTALAAEV